MPLEKLFGSKTRAKLLALFFENPDKSYYVREITRVIEEQINSVRRELTNLNALGLVKIEKYEKDPKSVKTYNNIDELMEAMLK